MRLQEIFNQLSHAEFSQLHLGNDGEGVTVASHPRIASAINTGLTALHTRFFLREERLTIRLTPGRFSYPLRLAYAQSSRTSREPVRYIEDSREQPFRENLLKIEQVFTDSHYELGLNDKDNPYSVQTPSMNVLTVPRSIVEQDRDLPDALKTETLTLVYRANHPILSEDVGLDDPEEFEVELPYTHLQALCYYVASRIHHPTGMNNAFHMGESYFAKYEMECQRLEHSNIQIDQGVTNSRFERNGWV